MPSFLEDTCVRVASWTGRIVGAGRWGRLGARRRARVAARRTLANRATRIGPR